MTAITLVSSILIVNKMHIAARLLWLSRHETVGGLCRVAWRHIRVVSMVWMAHWGVETIILRGIDVPRLKGNRHHVGMVWVVLESHLHGWWEVMRMTERMWCRD